MEEKYPLISEIKNAFDIIKSVLVVAPAFGIFFGVVIMFIYSHNEGFSFLEMAQLSPILLLAIVVCFAAGGVILAITLLVTMHALYVIYRWIRPEGAVNGSRYDRRILRTDIYGDDASISAVFLLFACSFAFLLLLTAVVVRLIQSYDIAVVIAFMAVSYSAFLFNMLSFDRNRLAHRKRNWLKVLFAMPVVIFLFFSLDLVKNAVIAIGARPSPTSRILVSNTGYDRLVKIAAAYGFSLKSCEIVDVGFILQNGTVVLHGMSDKTLLRLGDITNGRIIPIDGKHVDILEGDAPEVTCKGLIGF